MFLQRTTLRIGALRSAPTTLCIQLKRFSTFDSNGGKLNIKVEVSDRRAGLRAVEGLGGR